MGAESGTYFLEKDDRTARAVERFLKDNPDAIFPEIYARFFGNYANPVCGKSVSSRHFEPIGTKTCQILLDGEYNGVLRADEHYLSVKADYSNVEEVISRLKDGRCRQKIVEQAFAHVMENHTYDMRVLELASCALS